MAALASSIATACAHVAAHAALGRIAWCLADTPIGDQPRIMLSLFVLLCGGYVLLHPTVFRIVFAVCAIVICVMVYDNAPRSHTCPMNIPVAARPPDLDAEARALTDALLVAMHRRATYLQLRDAGQSTVVETLVSQQRTHLDTKEVVCGLLARADALVAYDSRFESLRADVLTAYASIEAGIAEIRSTILSRFVHSAVWDKPQMILDVIRARWPSL